MKELIVLSAVPGAGKSTWAEKYQKEHDNVKIISSDEVRRELTGCYTDFSRQKEVWELFEKRIVEYAKEPGDLTVILDAVIDLDSLRAKYAEIGKVYDKRTLVVIIKPYKDVKDFNHRRPKDKWVPEDVLQMMYLKFERPSKETIDIFDQYIYIDSMF